MDLSANILMVFGAVGALLSFLSVSDSKTTDVVPVVCDYSQEAGLTQPMEHSLAHPSTVIVVN